MIDGKPWSYEDEKKMSAESKRRYEQKRQRVNDAFQGMMLETFGCVITCLLVIMVLLMWGSDDSKFKEIFYYVMGAIAFSASAWIFGHKMKVKNR